jgi:hypothetical protein
MSKMPDSDQEIDLEQPQPKDTTAEDFTVHTSGEGYGGRPTSGGFGNPTTGTDSSDTHSNESESQSDSDDAG